MTSESGAGLRRTLTLLWHGVPEPARGPRQSLSLERIVRAAIGVADAEGLAAVSMRRVASELGAGAMSLYRYVPGKAELMDLMVDAVYAEDLPALEAAEGDWRAKMEHAGRLQWATFLRHPWLLDIPQGRPMLGPNAMQSTELTLRYLDGIGLDEHEMIGVVITVSSFVTGLARTTVEEREAARRTGVSDDEWWKVHTEVLSAALPPGRMPIMDRLGEAGVWDGTYDTLTFGLERILDGVAALVESRRRG